MTVTDGGERTGPVAVAHERYVAGELDEFALKRELEAALADADGVARRPSGPTRG